MIQYKPLNSSLSVVCFYCGREITTKSKIHVQFEILKAPNWIESKSYHFCGRKCLTVHLRHSKKFYLRSRLP